MLLCISAGVLAEMPKHGKKKLTFMSLSNEFKLRNLPKLSEQQLRTAFEKGSVTLTLPRLGTALWPVSEYVEVQVTIKSRIYWDIKELQRSWRINVWGTTLSLVLFWLVICSSRIGNNILIRPASIGMVLGTVMPMVHFILFMPGSVASLCWGAALYGGVLITICYNRSALGTLAWGALITSFVFMLTMDPQDDDRLMFLNLVYLCGVFFLLEILVNLGRKGIVRFKTL